MAKVLVFLCGAAAGLVVGQNTTIKCSDTFPFCTVTTANSFTVIKK